MKYQIADIINGPSGTIFDSLEQAEKALADIVKQGKEFNLEFSNGETDKGSDGRPVEEFFSIVEVQTLENA